MNRVQSEREELNAWKSKSEQDLTEQTEYVMHAVTQVRTPDELQNIYKELLKLKTQVMASFGEYPGSMGFRADKSKFVDSARKSSTSLAGSAQKRVSFPAVLA